MTIEKPLEMIKNAFSLMVKALFVLKILTFLTEIFGYVEKRFDEKVLFYFKIYDVIDWATNNYNTHITQYLKK